MKLLGTKTLYTSLAIIFISGCAGTGKITHLYDGPQKDPKNLTEFSFYEEEIHVLSIDGKETPPDSDFWGAVSYLYIPIGQHKFNSRLNWSYSAGALTMYKKSEDTKDFCFTSEPGKKYLVRAKLIDGSWMPTMFEGKTEIKNQC